MAQVLLIVTSVVLSVFIITLSLSAYGLGKEEADKDGPGYQSATAFTAISVIGIIISLIVLMVAIVRIPAVTEKVSSIFPTAIKPGTTPLVSKPAAPAVSTPSPNSLSSARSKLQQAIKAAQALKK